MIIAAGVGEGGREGGEEVEYDLQWSAAGGLPRAPAAAGRPPGDHNRMPL